MKFIITVLLICGLFSMAEAKSYKGYKILEVMEPTAVVVQSLRGNKFEETYFSKSLTRTYDDKTLVEEKKETNSFTVFRDTLTESNNHPRFLYTTKVNFGNVDMWSMGLPLPQQSLVEEVNKSGIPIDVKGYPKESIFYMPRIDLPKKPIKVGDSWKSEYTWKSMETQWPFKVLMNSELVHWIMVDGDKAAVIKYTGAVSLGEGIPIKGELKSHIYGELIYAVNTHKVLWGYTQSKEDFHMQLEDRKRSLAVESCTWSYSKGMTLDPKFEKFKKRIEKNCKLKI